MKSITMNKVVGLCIMAILLVPQIAHTLYVFEANSRHSDPWLFSWCYAVGVDVSIMVFTANGWIKTAFAYLFATLAHNLAYQFMPVGDWSALLISVMQSLTLFSLCHLFLKQKKSIRTGQEMVSILSEEALLIHNAMEKGVQFQAQPYICPACKEPFSSSKQLNGHVSSHKSHKEWYPEHYGDWELENRKRKALL